MKTIKSILFASAVAVGFVGGSVATAQTSIEWGKPSKPAAEAKGNTVERAAKLAAEGAELFSTGDQEAALGKFSDALKLDRSNTLALVGAACILNDSGDYATARRYATDAAEANPLNGAAWREAGFAEWRLGNLKQARVYLSKAMDRDGKDVFALMYLTQVLDDIGEKTEAVKLRRKKAQMETELAASATRMWY